MQLVLSLLLSCSGLHGKLWNTSSDDRWSRRIPLVCFGPPDQEALLFFTRTSLSHDYIRNGGRSNHLYGTFHGARKP